MRILLCTTAGALLAGCAGFSADGGLGPAQRVAQQHLGDKQLTWARTADEQAAVDARVAELLREPLTADAAVQIALFNHRGLQAALHELGIGEAELVQASRLPNPGFSFGRVKAGDEREIERALHFSLARVIALPWLRDASQRRFEATQFTVAAQVLDHGAAARRAWVQAVAAQEGVRYAAQVMRAAAASAELARRMQQVGNFSALQRAREQAFHADAALNLARAEQAERAAREKLTRALGLWGAQTAFALPDRLPDLPGTARELPDAERTALAQRLDVQAAQRMAQQSAAQLGLAGPLRFTEGLELGLERNSSNEGPTSRAGSSASRSRCSTGAARAACRPRTGTARRCCAPSKPRSTHAPKCARPTVRTAARTTSRAITATRSCRCAKRCSTRTCCATTAC
jgi:outer membrane protein TolC